MLTAQGKYDLQPINTPILHEELFQARLYHETWDSVYFLDILELNADIIQVKDYTRLIMQHCNSLIGKCTMTKTIGTLGQRINKLSNRYDNIRELSARRQKRGLFNFIGTATKYLFGTMNANDAENINNDIDEVYNKTRGIATLIKNQTSLLQATLSQVEKIQHRTENEIQTMYNYTSVLTDAMQINNMILSSLFYMELHVEDIAEAIQTIEAAISEAKNGIPSPKIVTPVNFMKSLSAIHQNIPKDTPYPLTEKNYFLYMKISRTDVTLMNNRLIYKIHTPIPDTQLFFVQRYIALPQHTMMNSYFFDGIQDSPIALSEDKTTYTLINEDQCIDAGELHFCQIIDVLKQIHTDTSCSGWLLSNEGVPCKKKYLKITTDYIYSFSNGFQWYISPYNPLRLMITCPMEKDVMETISLSTILTLSDHCKATTGKQTFSAATHYSRENPVKERQIKFNFSKIETSILESESIPLPVFSNTHLNLQQLKNSAHDLAAAHEDLSSFLAERRNHSWWTTGTTILERLGYTSLAILMLGLLWKCGLDNLLRFILLTTPCGKVIYRIKGPATINHATNAPVATRISYHSAASNPLFKTSEDMV